MASHSIERMLLGLASLALFAACGGGEEGPRGPQPEDITVASADILASAFSATDDLLGGRSATWVPGTQADLGAWPSEVVTSVELQRPFTGRATTLDVQVFGDGAAESVDVLIGSSGVTFIAWTDDLCRLAWRQGDIIGYAHSVCGGDGGVFCELAPDGATCTRCDAELCAPCVVSGTTATCEPLIAPEPEPEPEPDVGEPDTGVGEDTGGGEDTGVGEDTGGGEDAGVGEDTGGGEDTGVGEDTGGGEDTGVGEDTGGGGGGGGGPIGNVTEPGGPPICDDACVAEQDGMCCTECGCTVGSCRPVCPSGFEWDCSLQCCFNYDVLVCDCSPGTAWDRGQSCCVDTEGSCAE